MLLFLEYHFEKEYKLQLNCYNCISFGLSRKTKNWTCVRACVGMFVVSHKVLAFLIVDTDKFPNLWVGSWRSREARAKLLSKSKGLRTRRQMVVFFSRAGRLNTQEELRVQYEAGRG